MASAIGRRFVGMAGMLTVAAVVALSPLSAQALTVLTFDDSLKNIQQTENRPCVIGSPSCTQALPFTKVQPSDNPSPNLTSPTYTVGQLTTATGSSVLNLLVDVNQTGGQAPADSITTNLIEVFVNNTLQFVFNGPQVTPLTGSLQGNGFSDAGFRTLDFTPFASTDTVVFHIVWSNADDGAESWFLAPVTAQAPEPTTLVLLGSGILALGVATKRLRRK